MTPDLLARAGRLLAGDDWQRPLARLLGPLHPSGPRESIDDRLVRRWAAGERPVPDWVPEALAGLLERRRDDYVRQSWECYSLAGELRRMAQAPEPDEDDRPVPGLG